MLWFLEGAQTFFVRFRVGASGRLFEHEECGGWKPPLRSAARCFGVFPSFPCRTRALACEDACQWLTNPRTCAGLEAASSDRLVPCLIAAFVFGFVHHFIDSLEAGEGIQGAVWRWVLNPHRDHTDAVSQIRKFGTKLTTESGSQPVNHLSRLFETDIRKNQTKFVTPQPADEIAVPGIFASYLCEAA